MPSRLTIRLNQLRSLVVGYWFMFNIKKYTGYKTLVIQGMTESKAFKTIILNNNEK